MGKITNPNAAYDQSDPISNQFNVVEAFALSGTVAVNAFCPVVLVFDAATGTLKVEPWDTNATGQNANIGVGIAIEPITATQMGLVVLFGFARAYVNTGTPAEGNLVVGTTTANLAGVAAADATTVVGTGIGKYLGVKDADNIAPVWVCPL